MTRIRGLGRRERRTGGGTGSRRRLSPDARRTELLEAALAVLKELGPTRARVEDVTGLAGAAKGTFYLYFSSWDNLLLAVREHMASTYSAQLRKRLAASQPLGWEAIENECVRFVNYVVELGELHRAVFHGPAMDHSASEGHPVDSVIVDVIAAGVASGALRPVEPELAAPLLFAVLHSTVDSIIESQGQAEKLAAALDLLRNWLRA